MMISSESVPDTKKSLPTTNGFVNSTTPSVRRHQHRHNVKSRYEFLQTLGRGTYGKVKLARNKETDQYVAVKTIRKDKVDSTDMKHIRREMEIMSSIKHNNIIQIHEVFENHDKIVIVMEYAHGGELYDYLAAKRGIGDEEAKGFFRQIVSAVRFCHKMGIVHRDLKLENILLNQKLQIKIADFGLANNFKEDSLLKTFCGSPLYASPEIVSGVPYVGPEVDSWSLGVLLYALVYGTMPFDGRHYSVLTKQITEGTFCKPPHHSDAQGLIEWMLTVDPKKRATIDDIASHEWLQLPPFEEEVRATVVSTVETTTADAVQPKVCSKNNSQHNCSTKEQPPKKSILKRSEEDAKVRQAVTFDETLDGQLAAVCGLHAKDSLKLKNKPQTKVSGHGKRRVLRTRRDRESGYYSSPERSLAPQPTVTDTTASTSAGGVPFIKNTLTPFNPNVKIHTPGASPSSVSGAFPAPATTPTVIDQSGHHQQHRYSRYNSVSSDDTSQSSSCQSVQLPYMQSDSSIISSDSAYDSPVYSQHYEPTQQQQQVQHQQYVPVVGMASPMPGTTTSPVPGPLQSPLTAAGSAPQSTPLPVGSVTSPITMVHSPMPMAANPLPLPWTMTSPMMGAVPAMFSYPVTTTVANSNAMPEVMASPLPGTMASPMSVTMSSTVPHPGPVHTVNSPIVSSLTDSNMVIRPDTLPQPLPSELESHAPGALSPKSEKLVRDLERILAPSSRRSANRMYRNCSLDSDNDSSKLASEMSDFHSELELAYKKALDICANLNAAAEV